ncbi:TPA: hypothetical protein NQG57_000979 [Salmonella enterica subsp. enterica serovar Infantis]|nr:hypothetical protein [Salmonella enterica subsp. enterica serovar Infantis]HCJ0429047.1 hypothetical protein [Salmonella enterica subsp. enterica serovar Infantis]
MCEKINKVDLVDDVKTTQCEWFAIKDVIGLPGMPTTAQGCHKMLSKAAEQHPDLKRKIQGSKAYEFHRSLLPSETQGALNLCESSVNNELSKKGKNLLNQWVEIFNRMTEFEREQVINYVFRFGFGGIVSLAGAQSTNKIIELLDALPDAARREILQGYVNDKHGNLAPPIKSPDSKAG